MVLQEVLGHDFDVSSLYGGVTACCIELINSNEIILEY
jgi:hypothetical protein